MDLFEINEAFAAQSAAVIRDLGCDPSKVSTHLGVTRVSCEINHIRWTLFLMSSLKPFFFPTKLEMLYLQCTGIVKALVVRWPDI